MAKNEKTNKRLEIRNKIIEQINNATDKKVLDSIDYTLKILGYNTFVELAEEEIKAHGLHTDIIKAISIYYAGDINLLDALKKIRE